MPRSLSFPQPSSSETNPSPSRIRYAVVLVTTLMAFLLYLDRFCVGFAVDYIREDLQLSQRHISWFISAFFWSYALAQVPSGWLSDRYGGRIMLTLYILSWSFFTGMIGAVSSLLLLLGMRLGCGLGQAGAYPTSANLVSKWVPFANRGLASSVIAFGGRCGGALAPILTASLMVLFVPMGVPVDFTRQDLLNGPRLCAELSPVRRDAVTRRQGDTETEHSPRHRVSASPRPSAAGRHIWSLLPTETQSQVAAAADRFRKLESQMLFHLSAAKTASDRQSQAEHRTAAEELSQQLDRLQLTDAEEASLVAALNDLIHNATIYNPEDFKSISLVREALAYLKRLDAGETLTVPERQRLNRFLLEGTFSQELGKLYTQGWRPVMFVYGFAGLVVAGLFWFVCRNRPEQHPWCNADESALISVGRPAGAPGPHGKPGKVPLKRLLKSGSMWCICLMQLGTNVGWLFIYAWLPRYLIDVHQLPILERGLLASIPPAVGILGMLFGGQFTDTLVSLLGLRWGRRFPLVLTRLTGALGYGLVLWFGQDWAPNWARSPWAFTWAFSLVTFSTDMGTGSVWAFKQDVGGRYVGSILGWGNMWGNLGAAVSPLVYDHFLGETPSLGDWNNMFLVCMGAFIFAGVCALGVDATVPIAPPDEEHNETG